MRYETLTAQRTESSERKDGFSIDIQSFVRNRINDLFRNASGIEALRRALGITRVNSCPGDAPEWRVWIDGCSAIHALVLEEAVHGPESSGALQALFSVKCYPFPNRKEFAGFSFLERELVSSKLFDETNAPKTEAGKTIPAPLFVVAAVECALDREGRWSLLTLESQNLTRARYEAETIEDYPLIERGRYYCAGEVGREIPSWDLSFSFFDRFVSLWSHHWRMKPRNVSLETSHGYEYVFRSPDGWSCVEVESVESRALSVLFGDNLKRSEVDAVMGCFTSSGEKPAVLYSRDAPGQCVSRFHTECRDSPFLNPLWWAIPDMDFES
jgi:hypothetical protein